MSKIGLQLFSVWKDAEKDFFGTIQKVADLGYEGIQFAGFYNTPANKVKQLLDEKEILVAGAHVGIHQLLDDELEDTFEYHRTIENKLIICPAIPKEMRQTADDYKKTAETLNKIGEACKKAGFIFGYHNHDFEFKKFGNKTGLELLFDNTEPDLVKMELDCYWASFAEHDPIKIIRKYKNRVVSLHIKDMKIVNGRKTGTEVGRGLFDFASLINDAREFGVEWYTVEQEEFEGDQYESLAINVDNLKHLLAEASMK
ncbi:sugar phosphate isomerase/epimerase family protein [Neobacillus sp. C211]|uniref:sugar phosphate isomerase/epimerase family protein n=1 Tax=unclassified Neobacillus TaxID=2675272 RepID=UPI00397BE80A